MKILIFYTPRSKSTMIGKVLAKKFNIDYCESPLTISRLANKNFDNYQTIIDQINNTPTGCIKVCANDFVNLHSKCINEDYKKINFDSFDLVIFLTRKNMLDAVLSFGYMDSSDRDSWHRKKDQPKAANPYSIVPARIFNLLRGYTVFETIKKYISEHTTTRIYDCEYTTVEQQLHTALDLAESNFEIDLVPNGLPYKEFVLNYDEIGNYVKMYANANLPLTEFNNPNSVYWAH